MKFLKDKSFIVIMLSGFAWGIFAHGMGLFNKYSYHDDAAWFNGVGETYGLGRWFLGFSGKIVPKLFDSRNYSTPVYCGLLTIAAICVIIYLISLKLKIRSPFILVALSGVLVCFPAVTNIFGYAFTAPYYYIGALLGVAGGYLYYRYKNIPSFIACTLLMSLSVGLYQSNIAINLMTLLLFMLAEVYPAEMKWKDYFILAAKNAAICVLFMAEYFIFNAIALRVTNVQMYDYKGVNSFGKTSVSGYIFRVFTAYKRFLKPADFINYNGVSANMFPGGIRYDHMILVALSVVLIILLLRRKKSRAKITQLALIFAISPLFSYVIYIMVAEEDAHGGMGFGEAFMFFVAAFVIERLRDSESVVSDRIGVPVLIRRIAAAFMLIIAFMLARFSNVCYLKAEIMQEEAINYYNTLIARIQMTEGYTADTPVAFIEPRKKDDSMLKAGSLFEPIYLPPYQGNSIINDFAWEETMQLWCGFSPEAGSVPDSADIGEMPCYPDAGSVKMINGTVVVKFSD